MANSLAFVQSFDSTAAVACVKSCKKCNGVEFGKSGNCKACERVASLAYYSRNKKSVLEKAATFHAKNADRLRKKSAAYKALHKEEAKSSRAAHAAINAEKIASKAAAYRTTNALKIKTSRAAHRVKNAERIDSVNAEWRLKNPHAKRSYDQNRRVRKLNSGGKLSRDLSAKLFKLQKGKCPCCGQSLGDDFHLDHKMPLALGGLNEDSNMQLLRKVCNLQKSSAHPVDFMQGKGFLL